MSDKTQVFHDQIEAKQRELQPWTAKINTKERELNVAQGELDSLIKKTKEAELASQEAKEQLDKFQEDRQAKVYKILDHANSILILLFFVKERDLQHTQTEREKAQRDFQSKQSQRKVMSQGQHESSHTETCTGS
jgi:structural maintenance of chromosome 4